MGYIDRANQNAEVAAKAAAFDRMEQERKAQDYYARGANDISAEVERRISMQRAQPSGQARVLDGQWFNNSDNQRQMREAVNSGYWNPAENPMGGRESVDRMQKDTLSQRGGLASELIGNL